MASESLRYHYTDSIMKVNEYRFHIPIYHIFWELQFAELPECIAVSKLPGLDPVSGSAMAAPSVRSSRYSPSNPELYGNSRMPSGHSRRTTEFGRVEWH
jgi:hypothetical protein